MRESLRAKKAGFDMERRFAMHGVAPPMTPRGRVGVLLFAHGGQMEAAVNAVRNLKSVTLIQHYTIVARRRNKPFLDAVAAAKPFISAMYFEDMDVPKPCPSQKGGPGTPSPHRTHLERVAAMARLSTLYDTTVVMTPDVHICNDVEGLLPNGIRNYDFAASADPFARWAGSKGHAAGNMTLARGSKDAEPFLGFPFSRFPERNTAFMVLRTAKPQVRKLISEWLRVYKQQAGSNDTCSLYTSDQPALREALFKMREKVSEHVFPRERVCREGDALRGCLLRQGCATDGCDVVHCKGVRPANAHRSRAEIRGGKEDG